MVGIERGGEKGKGIGIIEEWRDGRVSGRAQESIPKNKYRQSTYSLLAGLYDNPIPTLFLAPIDCLKNRQTGKGRERKGTLRKYVAGMNYV